MKKIIALAALVLGTSAYADMNNTDNMQQQTPQQQMNTQQPMDNTGAAQQPATDANGTTNGTTAPAGTMDNTAPTTPDSSTTMPQQ